MCREQPTSNMTSRLGALLDRLRCGDGDAKNALIALSHERLKAIASRMLRNPHLRAVDDTDDLLQDALIRLSRSLETIPPLSVSDYLGLAAEYIRRSLVDLARRRFGRGQAKRPRFLNAEDSCVQSLLDIAEPDSSSAFLPWEEFHEAVGRLDADEKSVFSLRYYHGLSVEEAAAELGVSERTIKRRWQAACITLKRICDGDRAEE